MSKLKEIVLADASTEAKVAALAVLVDKKLLELAEVVMSTKKLEGPRGEQGLQGPKGEQGDRGFDGTNGKDGVDGAQGPKGEDGKDGVGVQDARIDFDGSLVITLTNGTEINAGDVVPMDVAEKIKVIGNGGGTSQSVLDAIDAINATIATYGTMAQQNDTAVDINGGAIDGTIVGAVTPAAGTFTTLTATSQTSLGGDANAEALRAVTTASAINWIQVSGATNGNSPSVLATGANTNVFLDLASKGASGGVRFKTSVSTEQMRVSHTASAVNYVQVTGAATGIRPAISAQGSDATVGLAYQSKGAPTDAHVFTNGSQFAQFRIGGSVSAVNYLKVDGSVTTNAPILSAQGSDTNIGLTLTPKGSGTVVANGQLTATGQTSLGGAAGSETVRVKTTTNTGQYTEFDRDNAVNRQYVRAVSANLGLGVTGGGATTFYSNSTVAQFNITHTASAVNYVQVTGGATGNNTTISAQGSDGSIGMTFLTRGTSATGSLISFSSNLTQTNYTFRIAAGSTANANYLQVAPAATTVAPVLSAQGSDTNIDLALTPKGTGLVKFGTYTAGAVIQTGYINIKAADGTTYKVLVGT